MTIANRHPAVSPSDLITCASCGSLDAPYHKPNCAHAVHSRLVSRSPSPLTCLSCGDSSDSLYTVPHFTRNKKGKLVRNISTRVCPSCFYWRYGWNQFATPKDLADV